MHRYNLNDTRFSPLADEGEAEEDPLLSIDLWDELLKLLPREFCDCAAEFSVDGEVRFCQDPVDFLS